ncbi:MAG: transposase [Rhodospirillum sp.]|nr:transposase [Rhodospirillum sp.]
MPSLRRFLLTGTGGVLLRETAERLDLFPRMAACFEDRRKADQVTHTLASLLAQRVMGIALGYEDLTDHDSLRHDPLLKLLGEANLKGNEPSKSLAGSSTLGRMERSFQDNNPRYHKITAQPKRRQDLFVDLFLESHDSPPERITLDIDATDIETH